MVSPPFSEQFRLLEGITFQLKNVGRKGGITLRYKLVQGKEFEVWVEATRVPTVGEMVTFYDGSNTWVERRVISVKTHIEGVTTGLPARNSFTVVTVEE